MSRILIVDDQQEIREMLLEILSYIEEIETKAISDPMQALPAMKQESFDLVITDLNMPRMTGIELSKEIRKTDKKMPIFLFTGDTTSQTKEMAEQAGIDEVIHKPVKIDQMISLIKRYLIA
ncbi:response regulator [Candidatus Woesearchaeota archaeon]|nr:response regulator [Candidatus Woesearchaeota archaeon]